MGKLRIIVFIGIALIIALLASCGGGGHRSPATIGQPTVNDNTKTQGGDNVIQPPDSYTSAPQTEISQDTVLVHTGMTAEEFEPVAALYGYSVNGDLGGHYLSIHVPDGNVTAAVDNLGKEDRVFSAETMHRYIMPRERDSRNANLKTSSYMPGDPMYADRYIYPSEYDEANAQVLYAQSWGQRVYMAPMGFEGAWDTAIRPAVAAIDVTIAVIDAGIWHDATTSPDGHPDFVYDPLNPTLDRVADGSGYVDAGGIFTPDEFWYDVDGGGLAYRTTGNRITGMLAAGFNNLNPFTMHFEDPPAAPGVDEPFVAGIAGITPYANVMIIKTGAVNGTNWEFTDAHIAASINHAVANGANVILLGMWAVGPVGAAVQTAINDARTADVLVVAPAGMAILDTTDPDFNNWTWDTIGAVATVTPAAAAGCLSVSGTGFEPIDMDDEPTPGAFNGYTNTLPANIGDAWNETASYSYTGGDMAAVGWAMTWAGTGNFFNLGPNVNTDVNASGNVDIAYAAAYVAGAASIVYQGLVNAAGGTPPADIDTLVEDILINESLLLPGGERFLAAGSAASVANNGGWDQVINSLDITDYTMSGAVFNSAGNAFLEVGQATDLAVSMTSNGGNYEIIVVWGDGEVYPNQPAPPADPLYQSYTPGDPIAHTYTIAGDYRCTVYAHETVNDTFDEVSFAVFVYNSLNATLAIKNVDGGTVTALVIDEVYQMFSNPAYNAVTGNVVTFDWDFNWDGENANFTVDVANRENPLFSYDTAPGGYTGPINYLDLGPGTYTIGLRVTQTRRPTTYYTVDVTVT